MIDTEIFERGMEREKKTETEKKILTKRKGFGFLPLFLLFWLYCIVVVVVVFFSLSVVLSC